MVVALLAGSACGGGDRAPTAIESVDASSVMNGGPEGDSSTSVSTTRAPGVAATSTSIGSETTSPGIEDDPVEGTTDGSPEGSLENPSDVPATNSVDIPSASLPTAAPTPVATAAPVVPPGPGSTTAPAPEPTAAPPSNTPAPPPPANPSLLSGLRIEPEYPSGYDRDLFRHWIDADGDGCDTRREVLIAEAIIAPQVGSGCSLTNGRWYSAYDGIETTDPSGFDIDHVIALKEAWDSGAWNWTADQRRAFANDLSSPLSLIAVTASTNRSKSDRDPAEWMPPLASYRCTYVDTWVRVKLAWNLSVDQAEYDALAGVLAGC